MTPVCRETRLRIGRGVYRVVLSFPLIFEGTEKVRSDIATLKTRIKHVIINKKVSCMW